MSRKTVVLAAVVALAAAACAGPAVNFCVLQNDSAVMQFKLSMLSSLFGELLTTESNGNIYVVSICRPIPKMYYDPRQLAGAVKITADGYAVDLGRIDRTDVVVNENTIVLTYVGGDSDKSKKDTCKGLKWNTYLTFECDPFATVDVLTLIDEDPDQPEICQIWFEIKTRKTCNREPSIPLDVLDKYLSNETKQNYHNEDAEKKTVNSNLPLIINPPFINHFKIKNNGEKKDDPNQNISNEKTFEEKKNNFIRDQNSSIVEEKKIIPSENNPFINKNLHYNKNEFINNGNTDDNHSKNTENYNIEKNVIPPYNKHEEKFRNSNSGEKSFNNVKVDSDKEKEIRNHENHENQNSNNIHSNRENEEIVRRTSSENKSSKNENENSGNTNKAFNHENQNENKIPSESENKENSQNTYPENESAKIVNINSDEEKEALNHKNHIHINYRIPSVRIHKENYQKNYPEKESTKNVNRNSGKENEPLNHENQNSNKISPDSSEHSQDNNVEPKSSKISNKKRQTTYPENESTKNANINSGKESEPLNHETQNSNKIPPDSEHSQDNNVEPKSSENSNEKTQTTYPEYKSTKNANMNSGKESDPLNHENQNSNNKSPHNENSQNNNVEPKSSKNGNENSQNTNTENESTKNSNEHSGETNEPLNHENKNSNNKSPHNENSQNNNVEPESSKNGNGKSQTTYPENESSINVNINSGQENGSLNYENQKGNKIPAENKNEKTSKNTDQENKSSNSQNTNTESTKNSNENSGNTNEPLNHESKNSNKPSTTDNESQDNSQNSESENKSSTNENETSDKKNNSVEIDNSSTKTPSEENQLIDNTTEDTNNFNNSSINNETNKINKLIQPDKSETKSSNTPADSNKSTSSSDDNDNNNNDGSTPTDTESQSDDSFSFSSLFSKIFPNGFQLSPTVIIGGLTSLVVGFGAIGTFINRYYYKLSGTDQIPFKGTFQSIYRFLKVHILNVFCCCGKDLEAMDFTNEKTPLLHPKSVATPTVEDETSKKHKKYGTKTDDSSSEQYNKNVYGSLSSEKTTAKKYRKKRSAKSSNKSSSDSGADDKSNLEDKLKFLKTEFNDLQGSSIKEVVTEKFKTFVNTKLKPALQGMFGKVVKDLETSVLNEENESEKTEPKPTFKSIFGKLTKHVEANDEEQDSSTTNEPVARVVEPSPASKVVAKLTSTPPSRSNENKSVIEVKTLETTDEKADVKREKADVKRAKAVDVKTTSATVVTGTGSVAEIEIPKKEIRAEPIQDQTATPSVSKTNESKLKFLVLDNGQQEQEIVRAANGGTSKDEKTENEDDVEIIEEVVYIDGDGEEGEEIIEEITETTTTVEDPAGDESNAAANPEESRTTVTTTVRKTSVVRKTSTSSTPPETTTVETTTTYTANGAGEKKPFGIGFGIDKSGVNVTVGEKKLGIGKSGVKFGKREGSPLEDKRSSPRSANKGEKPAGPPTSPKSKTSRSLSVPNFKMFKRSTSHQSTDSDIREDENEDDESSSSTRPTKKTTQPKTSAGLLIFGKTRSKSTAMLTSADAADVDVNALSSFIDNERRETVRQLSAEFGVPVEISDVAADIIVTSSSRDGSAAAAVRGSPSPSAKGVKKSFSFKSVGSLVGAATDAAATSVTASKDGPEVSKKSKSSSKTKRAGKSDKSRLF